MAEGASAELSPRDKSCLDGFILDINACCESYNRFMNSTDLKGTDLMVSFTKEGCKIAEGTVEQLRLYLLCHPDSKYESLVQEKNHLLRDFESRLRRMVDQVTKSQYVLPPRVYPSNGCIIM